MEMMFENYFIKTLKVKINRNRKESLEIERFLPTINNVFMRYYSYYIQCCLNSSNQSKYNWMRLFSDYFKWHSELGILIHYLTFEWKYLFTFHFSVYFFTNFMKFRNFKCYIDFILFKLKLFIFYVRMSPAIDASRYFLFKI